MTNLFRLTLAVMWLGLLVVTIEAGRTLGLDKGGDFFFGDMTHPWRAQFNVDFGFHLLLVAAWMAWHATSRLLGAALAVCAVVGGGMFTFAYLFVQSVRKHGNIPAVLLGRHYQEN